MEILQTYLKNIQNISETDKEHTHRGELKTLLDDLKDQLAQTQKNFDKISIIHEPPNDKSENKLGAPDFLITIWGKAEDSNNDKATSNVQSASSAGGGGKFRS